MNSKHLLLGIILLIFTSCSHNIRVIQGHAHNDYENKNPLFDAIENGFTSVEADVYLINDDLYVSHDYPNELNAALTLEKLYLTPLKAHILKNNGFVYPNNSDLFYLMIDIKSSDKPTYEKLKKMLEKYLSIISIVQNGIEKRGVVKIIISGNRPIDAFLKDDPKLVGIDGRPNDLNKNIPAEFMPVISDKYSNFLSWDGYGEISESEKENLRILSQKTHEQNKKLRLWGLPDNANVWTFLLDNGVDLINTDHLKEFNEFMVNYDFSID